MSQAIKRCKKVEVSSEVCESVGEECAHLYAETVAAVLASAILALVSEPVAVTVARISR